MVQRTLRIRMVQLVSRYYSTVLLLTWFNNNQQCVRHFVELDWIVDEPFWQHEPLQRDTATIGRGRTSRNGCSGRLRIWIHWRLGGTTNKYCSFTTVTTQIWDF